MAKYCSIIIEVLICYCLVTMSVAAEVQHKDTMDELLNMDLNDLGSIKIVTATRFEQYIQNSPSVISVITREEIQRYGGNSLLDVLQHFPGFIPVGGKAFGLHGTTFRGDTNPSAEHILVLLDGQPYRSKQTAQDSTGTLYKSFPLSAIERIELIHGPGSAIYGTNAMTGVINIITRKGANNLKESSKHNSEVNIQAGSWDTRQQTAHFNSQYNNWNTAITVENYKTDGWPITKNRSLTPTGTPFESVKVDRQVLHANVEHGGFHLRSLLVNYETLFPEFGADTGENNHRYWNIGYQGQNNDWKYSANLSSLRINNTLTGDEVDRNHLLEANASAKINPSLNFLFGISIAKADNDAKELNVNFKQSSYGAFTQFDYDFNQNWSGIAAAQWNKIDGGDNDISPRVGLIYHKDEYRGIKILYNEAFRSPTASETDVQYFIFTPAPTLIVSGNPDLKPETIKTLDVQYFSYTKQQSLTFGGFYSRYYDRVYQQPFGAVSPGSPITYLNGETVDMWGLEFESKWRLSASQQIKLGYTWQKNKLDSGEYDTTLAPRWTANFGYSFHFDNGVEASLFENHVEEFGDNGSLTATPNPASKAYDFVTVNLRMPLSLMFSQFSGGNKSSIVFLVHNALDEEIWQPETAVNTTNTFQVQYGRSYYITLEMQW